MFELIEGLSDGVVGFSAVGQIGDDDYETTLVPAIDEAVEQHGKIALLMVLGEEFSGFTAGAAADDARLGFSHATSFHRIALVSDNEWVRNGAAAMMYLIPGKGRGFSLDDLDAAKQWIADTD